MDTATQASRDLFTRVRRHRLAATFALLATLSLGILAGSIFTRTVGAKAQAVDSSDARPLTIPSPVILSNEFARISKAVGPAVVNINTITLPPQSANRRSAHGAQRGQPNAQPDPNNGGEGDLNGMLKRYFGGQDGQDPDDADPSGGEHEALGSGFIVDSRGYIITNNHVVDKAYQIFVKLASDPQGGTDHGRSAHVVGVDPDTDIAVIKIDAPMESLPTVKLGNSDGAQVGDWVLAIGSPFSLSETVTAGIVSAKNRSIEDSNSPSQFQRFIQTDAAINPGNSGGPLVDMAGQVIGMNTAIYTQSAGSQGVGFAMPSNVIANIYNMLISPEHKVVRGSIGIKFQDIPADSPVGRIYGFANGGVLVSLVSPNAPAARAGIKFGDAIVAVDGKPIKGGDDLVSDISARKVGSTVQLSVVRNEERLNLTVGIADRGKLSEETESKTDDSSVPTVADAGDTKLGIKVDAIPSLTASKIGVKGGVIVTSVRPGSFANMIGLAKDDAITAINRHPVTDQGSYNAIVSTLKSGNDVVFEVRSSRSSETSGPSFVYGTLP